MSSPSPITTGTIFTDIKKEQTSENFFEDHLFVIFFEDFHLETMQDPNFEKIHRILEPKLQEI